MKRRLYYRSVFVLCLLLASFSARAHEINPVIVDALLESDNHISFTLTLNLEAQLTGIAGNHDNTEDAINSPEYDALRALSPEDLNREAEAWLKTAVTLVSIGEHSDVSIAVSDLTISPVGDLNESRDSVLTLRTIEPVTDDWRFKWQPALGTIAFRFSSEETQDIVTAFLQDGEPSELIDMSNLVQMTAWGAFLTYIPVGFEHIVPMGLDHILFVIGLFLLSTHWKPLLWQVSAFTLAHTITLALGMLDILRVPGSIVEPLIALSIVYVAVENITFKTMQWWRPILIFSFGLLHGLGFASVLTEFGLTQQSFVAGLLGFNLGVEFGQLSVIAACFLVVGLWIRNQKIYRKWIVIPGSTIIAATGAFWFFQRILG
jgi:hypothetical protein